MTVRSYEKGLLNFQKSVHDSLHLAARYIQNRKVVGTYWKGKTPTKGPGFSLGTKYYRKYPSVSPWGGDCVWFNDLVFTEEVF